MRLIGTITTVSTPLRKPTASERRLRACWWATEHPEPFSDATAREDQRKRTGAKAVRQPESGRESGIEDACAPQRPQEAATTVRGRWGPGSRYDVSRRLVRSAGCCGRSPVDRGTPLVSRSLNVRAPWRPPPSGGLAIQDHTADLPVHSEHRGISQPQHPMLSFTDHSVSGLADFCSNGQCNCGYYVDSGSWGRSGGTQCYPERKRLHAGSNHVPRIRCAWSCSGN